MALKIAVIGAGSVGFTRKLMRDILSVPELQDTHFALTDISQPNLDLVTQLCQKDIRTNKLPAKVSATTERRRALRDADYVICCVRVGGLEAFKYDIDIPLKYGVDQCVGDTICAGGIMYAQRTIPQLLAFGDDIMDVAKPGALAAELREPDGHELLGAAGPWRERGGAVPRDRARLGPDRGGAGRGTPRGRGHHLRRHQPPDLVHPHRAPGPRDRQRGVAGGL